MPEEYGEKLDHKLVMAPLGSVFDWINNSSLRVALAVDGEEGPRFTRVSGSFLADLGIHADSIIGRRIGDVLSRETHLPFDQAIRRALANGQRVETVVPIHLDVSRTRRLSLAIHPVATPRRGVLIEVQTTSEEGPAGGTRRRALIDHLNRINAGAAYVYDRAPWMPFNLSVLLGYSPADGEVGRPEGRSLIHPMDIPEFMMHRRRLASAPDGDIVRASARMRHRDGGWRWIEVREQVLTRSVRGAVRQILGFAFDVTEQRQLAESLGEMSAALLKAEAEERRRIARELHDSMAQHLVAIDLSLSRLQRDPRSEMPAEAVRDIREALTAAHSEVRTFSYLLHPPDLERLGLAGTLRKFVSGFGRRTGLDTRLDIDEDLSDLRPAAELTLFRIAQEALMNVHQHAVARSVEVSLIAACDATTLEIRDDGVGLSDEDIHGLLADSTGGVGIAGMKARMEHLGGDLEITSAERGLRIRATLPDQPRHAEASASEVGA
ncbi:histidine kinase [Brevundimonas sp. Root1279]|uniref:histidine kinase n=1 Tax=Brevundimonas sp. Root1279 TaxID=1736443 RepID=UPI00138F47EC|nr:histidine kinase [Brevundimonas sp. Root1279]